MQRETDRVRERETERQTNAMMLDQDPQSLPQFQFNYLLCLLSVPESVQLFSQFYF